MGFTMKFRVRYLLVMLIFLVGAVVNIDRSNISIAGSFLAADYHISRIQLGWVFSAFMIGYAAFLIPAGWIVGRLGPRRTLTGGLIWWGALTTATALVPPDNGERALGADRGAIHPGAWRGVGLSLRQPVHCRLVSQS